MPLLDRSRRYEFVPHPTFAQRFGVFLTRTGEAIGILQRKPSGNWARGRTDDPDAPPETWHLHQTLDEAAEALCHDYEAGIR